MRAQLHYRRRLAAPLIAILLAACHQQEVRSVPGTASSAGSSSATATTTATTPASSSAASTNGAVSATTATQVPAASAASTVSAAGSNPAPTISGTPITTAVVGAPYSFTARAADSDGDPLTFSIVNKPSWAAFNASTGQLTGTPSSANAGTYAGITISVSDGVSRVSLPAFAITVSAASSTGSVTLSWTAPTQNADGSALTDLSGFRIYYGTTASTLTQTVTLNSPATLTYVISNLKSGTWYFAIKAINSTGAESALSAVGNTTV